MKKTIFVAVTALAALCTSCENFLDTENLTQKNTSNYPQTLSDAKQVIAGVYNNLNIVSANPQFSFLYIAELASDDRLGGGGENDKLMQAADLLMSYGSNNMLEQFWKDRYQGVFRANTAIETLGNCVGYSSENEKNQVMGEAYFLRAFYYYELASLFENIPLVVTSAPVNLPQATPDQAWGQIISDLKTAIELMPAKALGSNWVDAGHADRWAAEALMARSFLFYTGFYQKDDVTLPNGSKVTKADVVSWVDDCVTNSGYSLIPDFRNLWAYSNRLTKEDYAFTKGQGLKWVEDDNAVNSESMFAIKFSKFASYDASSTIGYANGYALFFGVRGGQDFGNTFPFGQGWGSGPVTPNLWKDWVAAEPNDIRRNASICNIPEELPGYKKGGWTDFVQETDYYGKKWSPISAKKSDGTYSLSFEEGMYDYKAERIQLANIHDLVLIRFADVLLMQSELKQNVEGINKVRTRAGLSPIGAYTDDALRNERRWEFNCEGIRWNDIRRWHIAEAALTAQNNQPTYYKGTADVNTTANNGGGYAARYTATRGFFPIPENQIALSNGVLKQNAGWGTGAAEYAGWK